MRVDEFIYDLPERAIAQTAIEPRDSAMLLDTRNGEDHRFSDLPSLLRPGDLVVVNNTRVRHARLLGKKQGSGGAVELLLLSTGPDGSWQGLIKPARRIRPGMTLLFDGVAATVLEAPSHGVVSVRFDTADVEDLVERIGDLPLPPYFSGSLTTDDRYQTMFASKTGSAAAPTAGLHFTTAVADGLRASQIEISEVDLHVGVDTFRPISVDQIENHQMHSEWCSVPKDTSASIQATRDRGGRVVAIGTTTTRALETFGKADGTVREGSGETDIFLRPGSVFGVVDLLVTNFHVPGSTLVAMIAGFMGPSWREAYQTALRREYRFLSFGDAMLCEREN